ncbi:band 7 protein AGAP004871-like [Eurosta solidaginis]|uniref:band 7 protein AGAP004871-like n=1 Tax=Eurosta solidaginis TaxID=178769 RepID=UPI00353148AC
MTLQESGTAFLGNQAFNVNYQNMSYCKAPLLLHVVQPNGLTLKPESLVPSIVRSLERRKTVFDFFLPIYCILYHFCEVLTAENDEMGCVEIIATLLSIIIMILTFPISIFVCFKVVSEYERSVIFRMGRLRSGGARGPGVFFVLPCVDDYCKVDLRTVSFDVPPQEVLSKDSVTVTVDAVVYYRISDPLKAVIQVSNYSHSTRLLAVTTLRNVLGTRNLSELLTERETISHTMQVQPS